MHAFPGDPVVASSTAPGRGMTGDGPGRRRNQVLAYNGTTGPSSALSYPLAAADLTGAFGLTLGPDVNPYGHTGRASWRLARSIRGRPPAVRHDGNAVAAGAVRLSPVPTHQRRTAQTGGRGDSGEREYLRNLQFLPGGSVRSRQYIRVVGCTRPQ